MNAYLPGCSADALTRAAVSRPVGKRGYPSFDSFRQPLTHAGHSVWRGAHSQTSALKSGNPWVGSKLGAEPRQELDSMTVGASRPASGGLKVKNTHTPGKYLVAAASLPRSTRQFQTTSSGDDCHARYRERPWCAGV